MLFRSRALGYVIEVQQGRWMARLGDLGSDLLSFGGAKRQAISLYGSRDKTEVDWIRELNLGAAVELDRAALETDKRKPPVDLMGGGRQGHIDAKIRAAVLETEVGFVPAVRLQVIDGDIPIELDAKKASRPLQLRLAQRKLA